MNEPETLPEKKKPSASTVLRLIGGGICILGGFFVGSSALVGDGLLTALHLVPKKNSTLFSVLSKVFGVFGLLLTVSSFFELSMTISYADSAVGIVALPLLTVILLLKAAVFFLDGKGSDGGKELFVSVGVTLFLILSMLVDFYFEPAFAAALGVLIFALAFSDLFGRKNTLSD